MSKVKGKIELNIDLTSPLTSAIIAKIHDEMMREIEGDESWHKLQELTEEDIINMEKNYHRGLDEKTNE
jgi:hypothetical protein